MRLGGGSAPPCRGRGRGRAAKLEQAQSEAASPPSRRGLAGAALLPEEQPPGPSAGAAA